MSADDAGNGGQADAGAGKLPVGVQTLEGPEEVVPVAHVEAGAVVADHEGIRFPMAGDVEFDGWMFNASSELPGIAKQVFQDRPHQTWIALNLEPGRNPDLNIPVRFLLVQFFADHLGKLREVDGASLQLLATDPG
jgi:hypothetical protein